MRMPTHYAAWVRHAVHTEHNTQPMLTHAADYSDPPRPARQPAQRRGTAIIEFALVLPLLLAIIFGIIEFSIVFYDKAVITNASREAARAGISYTIPRRTTAQIRALAVDYCGNSLISFSSATPPTVTVTGTGVTGTSLEVKVSYTYHGLLLGDFISAITGSLNLVATTTMLYE